MVWGTTCTGMQVAGDFRLHMPTVPGSPERLRWRWLSVREGGPPTHLPVMALPDRSMRRSFGSFVRDAMGKEQFIFWAGMESSSRCRSLAAHTQASLVLVVTAGVTIRAWYDCHAAE